MTSESTLSVTQLLRRMKHLLEIQIGSVWVEGEVSNLRRQPSGHWYFSLKDEDAQISCVMFGAKKREGSQSIGDGAKIRVQAEASVYEARGQLQIIITKAESSGTGDLQRRFEELKRKLLTDGLFDADRKKPIPTFPKAIGLITSASGAALQDILNVLNRRAPWVQPYLLPVRVQGKGAEKEIARAIRQLGHPESHGHPRCDVIIVGRGGGSLEDLWNFNEEVVARAIASSDIPIISAVGHEIDFTIADFVADLRAPTPSAAAELAVANGEELLQQLQQWRKRLNRPAHEALRHGLAELDALRRGLSPRRLNSSLRERAMRIDMNRDTMVTTTRARLQRESLRMEQRAGELKSHHPKTMLERRAEAITILTKRIASAAKSTVGMQSERLAGIRQMLRALGPEATFQRGYSITTDAAGRIIRSAVELQPGQTITTRIAQGTIQSEVTGFSHLNEPSPGDV